MMNTLPYHCPYGPALYAAMEHISEEAYRAGLDLIEMKREQATRDPIWDALRTEDPIFFNGVGHGNNTTFTSDIADEAEWVFRTTDCDILAGRVTYLLSCLTGRELGPAIVAAGGRAYGGYRVTWRWVAEKINQDPYDDYYAEGFWKSSAEFPMTLIRGGTVEEATQKCYDEYTRWINIWETERKDDLYAAEVIKVLLSDRGGLVVFGDTSARIVKEVGIYTIMRVEVEPPYEVDVGVPVNFSGFLEDEAGNRIPGKTINLKENNTIIDTTTTDENGRWAFSLTPEHGEYTLHAEFPGEGEYLMSRTSKYTVRVGLFIFGLQEVGDRDVSASYDRIEGTKYTCPAPCEAYSMTAYFIGGHARAKCAIYDSSFNLVGATEELTNLQYEGWYTFKFLHLPRLEAADYYLVIMMEANTWMLRFSRGGQSGTQSITYGPWPDPFTPSTSTRRWSIYCNCIKAVGPEHTLTVNSSPVTGVPIAVDGKSIGNTPVAVKVIEGSHRVETAEEIET